MSRPTLRRSRTRSRRSGEIGDVGGAGIGNSASEDATAPAHVYLSRNRPAARGTHRLLPCRLCIQNLLWSACFRNSYSLVFFTPVVSVMLAVSPARKTGTPGANQLENLPSPLTKLIILRDEASSSPFWFGRPHCPRLPLSTTRKDWSRSAFGRFPPESMSVCSES